jgi:glycosyltransferase involved in cell wall biosynthesis
MKLHHPLVSVVMPVYNGEEFLSEAVESILNQKYQNFEFIIINDGSTDGTLSIIKEFQAKDERIVLIDRENKGIIHSLNEGIEKSKGKYIARMDADDISMLSRFEKQVELMKNESLDICGGHYLLIDKKGRIDGLSTVPISHDLCGMTMIFQVPFPHPGVMIRKVFLINTSLMYGQSKYKTAEDLDLWVRMFLLGARFGNVDSVVIKYRVLNNSLSKINFSKLQKDGRAITSMFWLERQQYFLNTIKNLDIPSLSKVEKLTVVNFLIKRFIIKLDFLGLYRLNQVGLKLTITAIFLGIKRKIASLIL